MGLCGVDWGLNEPADAGVKQAIRRSPLSERIVVVEAQPFRQEPPMAEMSPLRRRMIEDMTVRNLSPATQRSYLHAVGEVQPVFRPLAGSAGSGGCPRLSGSSGRDRHLVAGAEPDRLRAAVLLWRDARPGRDPGAHPLCAGAAQAAGRAERRRGRALSRGGAEPEDPHGADDGLCRRAARLGGGRAQGRRHRQRADGDPRRAGQGRQGPLRHAVAAAARRSCAPTGGSRGRRTGCFPAATTSSRSTSRCCTPPAARPARRPAWPSR